MIKIAISSIAALVFLVAFILLAVIIVRPIAVFDTFWHLQMGRDLVEMACHPGWITIAFAYLGMDIYPVPVMFQVLLYKFVSFFGERTGFLLYKTVLYNIDDVSLVALF